MIDFLYVFNFNGSTTENAIKRLKCSISSIKNQDVRICISNNSEVDIENQIKEVCDNFSYIHKQYTGSFSRAHAINFGVRQFVKSDYFMISDIDLVYQKNHVAVVKEILSNYSTPIRLVSQNYNIQESMYSDDYDTLVAQRKNPIGLAHGNGLVHLESFNSVRGYDEDLIGYGPEDDLFNKRIAKINAVVYSYDDRITTAHIYHERFHMIQFEENHRIYNRKLGELSSIDGLNGCVIANTNKDDWGKI